MLIVHPKKEFLDYLYGRKRTYLNQVFDMKKIKDFDSKESQDIHKLKIENKEDLIFEVDSIINNYLKIGDDK